MAAIRKDSHPRYYPRHTVWRSTSGPVVFCGELIEGVFVYLNERESREVVKAWGWPAKEEHDAVVAELEETKARLAALEAEVEPLRVLGKAIEAARAAQEPLTPAAEPMP